jgi:hypothetical protein
MMRLLLWLAMAVLASDAAAQLATRKDSANGVTVAVTPANVAPGAKTWDFSVVLDTHTQDLSDDLEKNAVLVDERGNESKPLAWDGAAPGGHHRRGVLKFRPLEPRPKTVELRLTRPREAKPRIYRWSLE